MRVSSTITVLELLALSVLSASLPMSLSSLSSSRFAALDGDARAKAVADPSADANEHVQAAAAWSTASPGSPESHATRQDVPPITSAVSGAEPIH